jgi:hypothetical protein
MLFATMKDSRKAEYYVKEKLNCRYRAALAKFRAGVAPINVELGRYRGLPRDERKCFNCPSEVEDECHILLYCPVYDDIREDFMREICEHV